MLLLVVLHFFTPRINRFPPRLEILIFFVNSFKNACRNRIIEAHCFNIRPKNPDYMFLEIRSLLAGIFEVLTLLHNCSYKKKRSVCALRITIGRESIIAAFYVV